MIRLLTSIFPHSVIILAQYVFFRLLATLITSYKLGVSILASLLRQNYQGLAYSPGTILKWLLFWRSRRGRRRGRRQERARLDKDTENVVLFLAVEEPMSITRLRELFYRRVLNAYDERGTLVFNKLRYKLSSFLRVTILERDFYFELKNHIREYDLQEEIPLPRPCDFSHLKMLLPYLQQRTWWKKHSPWEVLLIPQFHPLGLTSPLSQPLVALRIHPYFLSGPEVSFLLKCFVHGCFSDNSWTWDRRILGDPTGSNPVEERTEGQGKDVIEILATGILPSTLLTNPAQ